MCVYVCVHEYICVRDRETHREKKIDTIFRKLSDGKDVTIDPL